MNIISAEEAKSLTEQKAKSEELYNSEKQYVIEQINTQIENGRHNFLMGVKSPKLKKELEELGYFVGQIEISW